MKRSKYIVFSLGYALLLCAVSIVTNWVILLPVFSELRGVNMLSVTVYTFYYCPIYVGSIGLMVGLLASFFPWENERKKNCVILCALSCITLAVQAFFFPS